MSDRSFKPELQGLRAVAVLLVFVFHLAPDILSGGYVGVDAFFVLSGYLITGSLVAEIEETGRIRFLRFYERRFRRLLPAATLVLAAMIVFLGAFPRDQWSHIAREIAAASVYVENLFLAHHSVDYLAFDRVASPVQHYWSLSVEEQFYLVWPLFLVGAAALRGRAGGSARTVCALAIGLVFLLSLAASIAATRAPTPSDYFYTHLRIWELALGGLVACAGAGSLRFAFGRLTSPLQWTGLGLLVASAVGFSARTVFPGYAALVPTVGAALVILVAAHGPRTHRNGVLDNGVLRWIGDISYSLYLWHWPIIVCVKDHTGGSLSLLQAAGTTVLIFGLSHLTKVFVEDRFRAGHAPRAGAPPRPRAFAAIALAIAGPPLASAAVLGAIAYEKHRFQTTVLVAGDYPGAGALLAPGTPPPARPFFPPAHLVPLDLPKVYASGCSLPYGASQILDCPSGAPDGTRTIAVVGDSHAAQWLPAFDVAGKARGWTVIPLTKSSCPLVSIRLRHADAPSCLDWTRNVMAALAAHPPDAIVTTLYLDGEIAQLDSDAARLAALQPTLRQLAGFGVPVIVLRDTPHLGEDPIAALDNPGGQPVVLRSLPRRAEQDVTAPAGEPLPRLTFLDMNDLVCPGGRCQDIIGNVVVWRDTHHITAHYAETLGPPLAERLHPVIAGGSAGKD